MSWYEPSNIEDALGSMGSRESPEWAPTRWELRDWLRHQAPALAPAYEGAVELLARPEFPGRIHFIAHAVRDIADRLVFALDQDLESSRVQYENHLDEIAQLWQALDELGGNTGDPADVHSIPWHVAKRIDRLVTEHRTRRDRPDQYDLLFQHLMRNDPSGRSANRYIVRVFKNTRRWFMSLAHLRADTPPSVDEAELKSRFETFERALHSFVGNFFTGTRELDDILQKANG